MLVGAAEIADSAVAGVDGHPDLERPLLSCFPPLVLQLTHAALHRHGHANASFCILLAALGLGIAKKQEHCIANIFVDCRSMFERDHRHLGQVVIEQPGDLLGLEISP
jgi:hypothetical protein